MKRGKFNFNSRGVLKPSGLVSGAKDEYGAYRLQYSYNPNSLPKSDQGSVNYINQIDFHWIAGINHNGSYPYSYIKPYAVEVDRVKKILIEQQNKIAREKFINRL